MEANKIYFDLETTGFHGLTDDLIEIYMIKESPTGQILGDVHIYLNPGIPLPQHIINITKITNEMLADKSRFTDQFMTLVDFISPTDILIGHNAISFDLVFLNNQFKKHNIQDPSGNIFQFCNVVEDTMVMARAIDKVDKYTKGYKLIDLANKFNFDIDESKFHGAKYDVEITKELYKILKPKLI